MTSRLFTTFIKLFSFASGLVGIAALLESLALGGLPKGTFLCLIEFAVGIATVAWTYRSPQLQRRRFANAILCITLADSLFYLFNYYLLENLNTNISSLFPSFLYGCGFLSASFALVHATQLNVKRNYRKILVPAITILVLLLYYFIPTLIEATRNHTPISQHLFNGIIIALNVLVATVALTVLTQSMNSFLIFFSLGFTTLPLLNFSISSEIFSQGNLSFGFYEYFWAFGVFMSEGSLLFFIEDLDLKRDHRLSLVSQSSIGVQYKTSIIAFIMIALIGASLVSQQTISIKVVTFGMVAGIIFAVVISSFTVETVSRYSSLLGKYLQHGFTSKRSDRTILEKLPLELEVLFSSVFAQNLEKERERQTRAAKYNDLYQKFAHDIRSPLQALSNLLQKSALQNRDTQEACLEAIQSMSRASNKILDELETGAKGTSHSSLAVHLSSILARAIRIFESSLTATRPISIEQTVEPTCRYVWMDEITLERLLLNILTNSADAPGVSQIRIRIQRSDRFVMIEIQDNGTGADSATLDRLNRGDVVTTKSGGHGIGLSAHRETLSQSGGEIRFESEKGKFFKTTITLVPASDKIVLIDDDRAIHLAWRALAKAKGVDLITLGPNDHFENKLSSLRSENPEIYVDYHLGNRSGVEVLQSLSTAGFENVFLATSDGIDEDIRAQWRVRDKTFPR